MLKELDFIIDQLRDAYEGDPWFGRNIKELVGEINEETAFIKLHNQHSVLELVWHMVTWREFVIDRLQPAKSLAYFEENDWRELNHNDKSLWQQGLLRLHETQEELHALLQDADDTILEQRVQERAYNFRKLLHGLIQHNIYHLGQIAYITKCLKEANK